MTGGAPVATTFAAGAAEDGGEVGPHRQPLCDRLADDRLEVGQALPAGAVDVLAVVGLGGTHEGSDVLPC